MTKSELEKEVQSLPYFEFPLHGPARFDSTCLWLVLFFIWFSTTDVIPSMLEGFVADLPSNTNLPRDTHTVCSPPGIESEEHLYFIN